jgi:ribA/ribD-fused uncharacterized protein
MPILTFAPQYHFLSNAVASPVWLEQQSYPTVDMAFQAAKTDDPETRNWIRDAPTPRQVWWRGRTVKLPDDWAARRVTVMERLLAQKFTHYPTLRARLLATGEATLIYVSRHDCDAFWGTCDGAGKNQLGVLLMTLRTTLQRAEAWDAWKLRLDGVPPEKPVRVRQARDPLAS